MISATSPLKSTHVKSIHVLDEESEVIKCEKCNFNTEDAKSLRQHIVKDHGVNIFHGLELRNNNALNQEKEKD